MSSVSISADSSTSTPRVSICANTRSISSMPEMEMYEGKFSTLWVQLARPPQAFSSMSAVLRFALAAKIAAVIPDMPPPSMRRSNSLVGFTVGSRLRREINSMKRIGRTFWDSRLSGKNQSSLSFIKPTFFFRICPRFKMQEVETRSMQKFLIAAGESSLSIRR